jgi:uncharacterized protein
MITYEIRNAELMAELARRAKEDGIKNAAIISLIGAVDEFVLTTMPMLDPLVDVPLSMTAAAEMSGTGEIVDGSVHVHASMAVEGGRVIGGHLVSAQVQSHFARIYLATTD